MPVHRKVNSEQMDMLLNFIEKNKEVGFGRHPGGPYGTIMVRQAWQNLAGQLNTVLNGCTKTPEQWRRYWIEFKAKTRSKAADSRRSTSNGEKVGRFIPLTQHEERALLLSGNSQIFTSSIKESDDGIEELDEESMPEISPYPDPLRIHKERKCRRKHYRPIRQEDKPPAWVMRLEERRIAAEERLATAVEALTSTLDERLAMLSEVFERTMREVADKLPS